MKKKNQDDEIRFKMKQKYATISDWAFKTLETQRVQEIRAKSLYSGSIKIQHQEMYSFHYPSKSINTKKAQVIISQQPRIQNQCKINKKLIESNQIPRSLDQSYIEDSKKRNIDKKRVLQDQKVSKQFQAIHNKMKLIMDSYKNRERELLNYIVSLQQEIIVLKESQNDQTN
ncbi:unnamed protein product [Paramecium sonneborni]|uniref:Uncharacterized protein n=1 Tax=Paramecium sonneborni TaxID=65129 RepID=A0A8S1NN38_9CILI|nr:unnamed protein product [Paramecium sonneborni]